MKLLIVRRRRLGYSTCKAFSELLGDMGLNSVVWRNDQSFPQEYFNNGNEDFKVLRWGCTSSIPHIMQDGSSVFMNQAKGIHRVNDKLGFLERLAQLENQQGLLPLTTSHLLTPSPEKQYVVRPRYHSQGKNLRVMTGSNILYDTPTGHWYARPLVNKKSEYRAYVVNGRVVNLARKTPDNPDAVAWNVAQGGRFDNVRWGDWPINVVDLACRISTETGLNITGIDIMVDQEDNAWFIEANSAPSLPYNSDGSHTYRQKCMSKGIYYTLKQNDQLFEYHQGNTWRDYIHPAIYEE